MRNFRLGKIFGIEIELHATWFLIIILLSAGLAIGYFPDFMKGAETWMYWLMGLTSALLLFASVLLHELAHSLVAQHNNIKVERIMLFFFGGIASIDEDKMTAQSELRTALAGPVMSIFIGIFCWLVLLAEPPVAVTAVFFYLLRINFILAGFNLVPGFPLDGGRVFRAFIWGATGNYKKATKYAATGGKIFAYFLIIMGFANILLGAFGGLWFVLIGFFILNMAKNSYQQAIFKVTLKGTKVKNIMDTNIVNVKHDTNLEEFAEKFVMKYRRGVFPVVKNKKLIGLVALATVERFPKMKWSKILVEDITTPLKTMKLISPETDSYAAFTHMMRTKSRTIPVMDKDKLVGLLNLDSLMNYVNFSLELEKKK